MKQELWLRTESRSAGSRRLCWVNGALGGPETAVVSAYDHGLLYGDGVFEGIRFYHGRPFRLAEHLERLEASARALCLELPYTREELAAAVAELVTASGLGDGYLRLLVTRGEGALGLDPARCERPNVLILADRISLMDGRVQETGARLVTATTRRLPLDGLDPRIKSLNYLNHILARLEANNAGADEALLLNAAGRVAEGSADNLFLVRGDQLLTPRPEDGALEGVTRAVVMALGREAGLRVREAPLALYDVYTAEECFLTGTAAELIPVAEVDGRRLPAAPGPVFRRLREAFRALVAWECGDPGPA